MEKENWIRRASRTKRFWGGLLVVVGAPLSLIPFTAPLGGLFLATGLPVLVSGVIDKVDETHKEKQNNNK